MEKSLNQLLESVAGKSVLITGGTTGIGRATALLLAYQGANVLITGLDPQHLQDALHDIKKIAKGDVYGIIADLATEEGIEKIFSETDSKFRSLDILVNNAALAYGSVTEGNYKDWKRVVDTNLLSYLACAGGAINRMKKK